MILRDAAKGATIKPSLGFWIVGFKTTAFSNIFHGEVVRAIELKIMKEKGSVPTTEQRLIETWRESVKIVLTKWLRARRLIIDF